MSQVVATPSRLRFFFNGAVGLLGLFFALGAVAVVLGGHMTIDTGGVISLIVIGGVLGLGAREVYEAGRRAGQAGDSQAADVRAAKSAPRVRPVPFVWAWTPEDEPRTAREALERFVGVAWARLRHELVVKGSSSVAIVESPDSPSMSVRAEAVEDADEIALHIEDDLGGVFTPTGPWRGKGSPNEGLRAMHVIVERIRQERLLHVVRSNGDHAMVLTDSLPELLEEDAGVRVRSWMGTHDRGEPTLEDPSDPPASSL